MKALSIASGILSVLFFSCSASEDAATNTNPIEETPEMPTTPTVPTEENPATFQYLALGDSYTIGQSVCETCRFPEQLKQQLMTSIGETVGLKIIARTGWTTKNLQDAITAETLTNDYDLVTLLIGVNNQYQGSPFSNYEEQFPLLLSKAIELAKGDKNNVLVVSIPDYAYTPFGQSSWNADGISAEIDQYNAFAESHTLTMGIKFVNITDITRQGLDNPNLVASDGLHPSQLAYSKFVERLLPISIALLQD